MDLSLEIPQDKVTVDPSQFKDFSKLDSGRYQFLVKGFATGTNTKGKYVQFKLEVISDHSNGRTHNIFFNYKAAGKEFEESVSIDLSRLQEFHAACGLNRIGDLNLVIGKTPIGQIAYKLHKKSGKQFETQYWMNGSNPIQMDGVYTPAPVDQAPEEPVAAAAAAQPNPFAQQAAMQQPLNQPQMQQPQQQAPIQNQAMGDTPFATFNQQ